MKRSLLLRTTRICIVVAILVGVQSWASSIDYVINNAAFGDGPIQTFDSSTGTLINQFLPSGATGSNNGRAVAATNTLVYYTELTGGFGPSDGIHVAPFNGGAGGADITVLANPAPGEGIQDLAFANGFLYAMVGYLGPSLQVLKYDPGTGNVLATTSIVGNSSGADGFTVLPNGNFLINTGDASGIYNQFDPTTGLIIPGTTISNPGDFSECTGVDTNGTSLFFTCNFNTLVITDMSGNNASSIPLVGSFGEGEDSSLVAPFNPPPPNAPEPASLFLLGSGLLALGYRLRRKK